MFLRAAQSLCLALPVVLPAAVEERLPIYEAREVRAPTVAPYVAADGAIAIVGYNDMAEMMEELTARFTALHPGFVFALQMPGTKAAAAALADGKSALAALGAPLTPAQRDEFRATNRGEPLEIRIAGGSLSTKALSGPVVVIVHRDNPLDRLDAAALAAQFSGPAGQGRLRPHGPPPDAPLAIFFRERVLGGGSFAADYVAVPRSNDVVQAVAADPQTIGFARANALVPGVRALAVATEPGQAAVEPTPENLATARYPLDWHLYLAVRRPVEPWIAEFIRFVLSAEGQALIARGTLGYRTLSAAEVAAERRKLP